MFRLNNGFVTTTPGTPGNGITDVPWTKVKDKPTAFPAAPHSHAAGDIAGLDALIAEVVEGVIGGGAINRPPVASAIPIQFLTVGSAFSENFSGYFNDPDGDALTPAGVVGTLPPGIVQNGFSFTGTPTQAGNYTVTLIAADGDGLQASSPIAWNVAADAGALRAFIPDAGGYDMQNPGTIPSINPVPAIGGYIVEFA